MTTIYFDQTGPLVRYDGEMLHIQDLNPEIETRWRMSRWDMVRFGLRAIRAAFSTTQEDRT